MGIIISETMGWCRLGQHRFQAGQVHGRMEILADRFSTQAREIFQIQPSLEEAIEGFDIPLRMPLYD
jgi:hypothetical protein